MMKLKIVIKVIKVIKAKRTKKVIKVAKKIKTYNYDRLNEIDLLNNIYDRKSRVFTFFFSHLSSKLRFNRDLLRLNNCLL